MSLRRLLSTLLFTLVISIVISASLSACTNKVVAASEVYALAPGANRLISLPTSNGQRLYATWWQPAGACKGVVLLLPGTALYGGFYYPWANFLQAHGYAVLAPDLRSWGQSQIVGLAAGSVSDYAQHVTDLEDFMPQIKTLEPGKPVFLQGESMGGTIALLSQEQHRIPVAGLLVNSPAMHLTLFGAPQFISQPFIWATAQVGKVLPNTPGMLIPPESALGLVINDPDLRHRLKTDPLVVQVLPLGYLTGLEKGITEVEAGLAQIKTPLLIIHGEKDNLVPLSSSEEILARVSSQDKTLKTYPGLGHVSLLDTGKEKPWQDMLIWLDEHSAPKHTSSDFNVSATKTHT